MRTLLRRLAVVSASAALIFFCSCERHSPEELGSHGDHGKADGHGHGAGDAHGKPQGNSGGLANEHGHDHSKPESHSDGHDHGHADPTGDNVERPSSPEAVPPVAGTPAQFFPAGTPATSPSGSPH